jgi:hypothetical protein
VAFSLWDNGVGEFFRPVFPVRHWFLPQGLQGKAVAPMYTRFACLLVTEFLLMLEFGYLDDEISRRGVMSRVCPDMESPSSRNE